jgi:hypothetical protein
MGSSWCSIVSPPLRNHIGFEGAEPLFYKVGREFKIVRTDIAASNSQVMIRVNSNLYPLRSVRSYSARR